MNFLITGFSTRSPTCRPVVSRQVSLPGVSLRCSWDHSVYFSLSTVSRPLTQRTGSSGPSTLLDSSVIDNGNSPSLPDPLPTTLQTKTKENKDSLDPLPHSYFNLSHGTSESLPLNVVTDSQTSRHSYSYSRLGVPFWTFHGSLHRQRTSRSEGCNHDHFVLESRRQYI